MAKPMLVTLPFVLLLLDFWPLRRSISFARLCLEKVPFLLLSAIDSFITFSIQRHGGSIQAIQNFPLAARVANALVSYVRYLGKMVWPSHLSPLYLRHGGWPLWTVIAAGAFLLTITAAVLWQWRRRPFLAVGWFWYLGTLVPVIGLVQVGMQSMADRYTYLPLVGLFIALAWWAPEWPVPRPALAAGTAALLASCFLLTERQTRYWVDSETLFQRMIAVTDRNYIAHYNLANEYSRQHRFAQAEAEYRAALRDEPAYADAANNLGGLLLDQKRYDEALQEYAGAARLNPGFFSLFNLANALADAASARHDDAFFARADETYRQALALNPRSPDAHHNFGLTLAAQGDSPGALAEFQEAVRAGPDSEPAQFDLAEALAHAGRPRDAVSHYEAAARLNPNRAATHRGLGLCAALRGDMPAAAAEFRQALRLNPSDASAYGNLANALGAQNQFDAADDAYAAALKLNPSDPQTEFNFGLTLLRQGRPAEARAHLQAALRLDPANSAARRALAQIPPK